MYVSVIDEEHCSNEIYEMTVKVGRIVEIGAILVIGNKGKVTEMRR